HLTPPLPAVNGLPTRRTSDLHQRERASLRPVQGRQRNGPTEHIGTCCQGVYALPSLPGELLALGHARSEAIGLSGFCPPKTRQVDRKSTRLNSSHLVISYAVF